MQRPNWVSDRARLDQQLATLVRHFRPSGRGRLPPVRTSTKGGGPATYRVYRTFALILATNVITSGCAHTQLNYNTVDLATTIQSIYREQALINLSRAIDDRNTIPSQVDISSGQASTQNQVSAQGTFPLGNQVTKNGATLVAQTVVEQVRSLMLGVNDQWTQNWSLTPVSDANALRRLRAVYRYAIDGDEEQLKKDYNLNVIAQNNNLGIDASRLLKPQCVICLTDGAIENKQQERRKNEIGMLIDPSHVGKDDASRKILQQQIANEFAATNNLYTLVSYDAKTFAGETVVNPKLPKGWLYWETDSGASPLVGQPAGEPRPIPRPPAPRCSADPDTCRAHSLGHYGNHELVMTVADYKRGVLGDFLLFLLPQADPRLPVAPAPGGGSQGGGAGGGKSGSG